MYETEDWGAVAGYDLEDYVNGKVGTGIVREPTDWEVYLETQV